MIFWARKNHTTLPSGITNCADCATWSSKAWLATLMHIELSEEAYVRCMEGSKAMIKFIKKVSAIISITIT